MTSHSSSRGVSNRIWKKTDDDSFVFNDNCFATKIRLWDPEVKFKKILVLLWILHLMIILHTAAFVKVINFGKYVHCPLGMKIPLICSNSDMNILINDCNTCNTKLSSTENETWFYASHHTEINYILYRLKLYQLSSEICCSGSGRQRQHINCCLKRYLHLLSAHHLSCQLVFNVRAREINRLMTICVFRRKRVHYEPKVLFQSTESSKMNGSTVVAMRGIVAVSSENDINCIIRKFEIEIHELRLSLRTNSIACTTLPHVFDVQNIADDGYDNRLLINEIIIQRQSVDHMRIKLRIKKNYGLYCQMDQNNSTIYFTLVL